jgi:hypothetical protein
LLPERSYEWFLWCRRNKRGDLSASRALADTLLPKAPRPKNSDDWQWRFEFYAHSQQYERTVEPLRVLFEMEKFSAFYGLHLAIETDDAEERARILGTVMKKSPRGADTERPQTGVIAFAGVLRDVSGTGGELDLAPFERVRDAATPREKVSIDYYLGRILERKGDLDRARRLYERARDANVDLMNCDLAREALERLSSKESGTSPRTK